MAAKQLPRGLRRRTVLSKRLMVALTRCSWTLLGLTCLTNTLGLGWRTIAWPDIDHSSSITSIVGFSNSFVHSHRRSTCMMSPYIFVSLYSFWRLESKMRQACHSMSLFLQLLGGRCRSLLKTRRFIGGLTHERNHGSMGRTRSTRPVFSVPQAMIWEEKE